MKNIETIAIRTQTERSSSNEHSAPIYLTSSYVFEDAEDMRSQFAEEKEGHIYSRYANPNVDEFIQKLTLMEGAESGWATATGMAAVFSCFAGLLKCGDHIVSSRSVFGSTHKLFTEILPKWGIETTYVDSDDLTGFENAIRLETKILYIETPSNPALDILDLEAIGAICKKHSVLFAVDNCFATPVLQRPIEFGADIVIHSATKYIDGQGRTMGGAILSSSVVIEQIKAFARHSGPALSPFNAWVLSKSIETLPLRIERHSENALKIAERLEKHPSIKSVRYPFLTSHPNYELAKKQMSLGGGIVSFEIKGGIEAGKQFLDGLKMFSLTANLGDTRSIATHPASTTHSKLSQEERVEVGITDGLVRLSIGLENCEDIWQDLEDSLTFLNTK
ncbi:MAG: O-succinylhomoserine sulfhydrylase [Crocinitomicaceae bacterium]|nr:O-succinylhomoserine sulfhydrylase [Flavobacteriales bacterium]NQZ35415.1 O-succinylhomoserine sulfhydrylase [Crocinitomicaceae bacterium]